MEKINSAYDIENISEEELSKMDLDDLKEILEMVDKERSGLQQQYYNGDPDIFPPDWYDYYVFPLDCSFNKVEDVNNKKENPEDSEEV